LIPVVGDGVGIVVGVGLGPQFFVKPAPYDFGLRLCKLPGCFQKGDVSLC